MADARIGAGDWGLEAGEIEATSPKPPAPSLGSLGPSGFTPRKTFANRGRRTISLERRSAALRRHIGKELGLRPPFTTLLRARLLESPSANNLLKTTSDQSSPNPSPACGRAQSACQRDAARGQRPRTALHKKPSWALWSAGACSRFSATPRRTVMNRAKRWQATALHNLSCPQIVSRPASCVEPPRTGVVAAHENCQHA